jgi:glycosyltransferase involved in cell wall biosynthesis
MAELTSDPLVSVLIPTFNQQEFIGDAIESALRQDYRCLEVVVCDDASIDKTGAIASGFEGDARFRYYRNPSNFGRLANYRRLLYELARGEWVISLDGDDFFLDHQYISQAIKLGTSDPEVVLVFGKAAKGVAVDVNKKILNADFGATRLLDGSRFCFENPPYETVAPLHQTCLYRRDLAISENFYQLNEVDSIYRMMLGRKIGFLNRIATLWRQHSANATSFLSFEDLWADQEMLERICQSALDKNCFTAAEGTRWLRQRMARFFLSMLKQTALGRYTPSASLQMTPHLVRRNPAFIIELPRSIVRTIFRS